MNAKSQRNQCARYSRVFLAILCTIALLVVLALWHCPAVTQSYRRNVDRSLRLVIYHIDIVSYITGGRARPHDNTQSQSAPAPPPPLPPPKPRSFSVDKIHNVFVKDDQPFQYISGSLHYARVPPAAWRDRLAKMKAAGLDAVQTYVPWNFHEEVKGSVNFSGDRNLTQFLDIANEVGLLVILRAGPYICAEWDFGGLPGWLLKINPNMKLRSSDPDYLQPALEWMRILLSQVKHLLYKNGGPIIMIQLENEYGSYNTNDQCYLQSLYNASVALLGSDTLFFTTDGNTLSSIVHGSSDRRMFATCDFGAGAAKNPESAFSALTQFQPNGPLVNSEYYTGWLDVWGVIHQTVPTSACIAGLNAMLNYRKGSTSVNMYMFHGGSTFGFWNGANSEGGLLVPQITSYDYDAHISESGDITQKYLATREFIGKFRKLNAINTTNALPPIPPNSTKMAYGKVSINRRFDFPAELNLATLSKAPLYMEQLDQNQGFMIYSTRLPGASTAKSLHIEFDRIGDFAYIFTGTNHTALDLKYHGHVWRFNAGKPNLTLRAPRRFLFVLVENAGHVNFGAAMRNDIKGLIGAVRCNGKPLADAWTNQPVRLDVDKLREIPLDSNQPWQGTFFAASWTIDTKKTKVADTFLKLDMFTKGQVLVNGRNLGRYWNSRGPQYTLYVPASWLRAGTNYVIVFELLGLRHTQDDSDLSVEFVDKPILNGPVNQGPLQQPPVKARLPHRRS